MPFDRERISQLQKKQGLTRQQAIQRLEHKEAARVATYLSSENDCGVVKVSSSKERYTELHELDQLQHLLCRIGGLAELEECAIDELLCRALYSSKLRKGTVGTLIEVLEEFLNRGLIGEPCSAFAVDKWSFEVRKLFNVSASCADQAGHARLLLQKHLAVLAGSRRMMQLFKTQVVLPSKVKLAVVMVHVQISAGMACSSQKGLEKHVAKEAIRAMAVLNKTAKCLLQREESLFQLVLNYLFGESRRPAW
eukprot:TRINITY_DN14138_c0_g1_i1.p1 TRINITY_DN14138_c0_g1~~TRINITY_DN14138_c0_g1_i1.p1  ORF type:complete len:251 (+),score=49.63 TRINITY_DN14138_c0_g1_i1:163-915(+)